MDFKLQVKHGLLQGQAIVKPWYLPYHTIYYGFAFKRLKLNNISPQGFPLALANSSMQVSKLTGEWNSMVTCLLWQVAFSFPGDINQTFNYHKLILL